MQTSIGRFDFMNVWIALVGRSTIQTLWKQHYFNYKTQKKICNKELMLVEGFIAQTIIHYMYI